LKVFIGHSFSEKLDSEYYLKLKEIYSYLYLNNYEILVGGLHRKLEDLLLKYQDKITCYSLSEYQEEKSIAPNVNYIIKENSIRRSEALIVNSDIILFLPGGTGTLSEIFSAIEYNRTLKVKKKIIIYDYNNHYDKILDYINYLINNLYNESDILDNFLVVKTKEELEIKLKEGN
jgi:predicted Rossmann-fold nucleotide-binding protein